MHLQTVILGLTYLVRPISSASTQTIASLDSYNDQRDCATPCFWNGDPNNKNAQDVLGITLKCCSPVTCEGHAADSCFCRADLRPSAVSWLSTCVSHHCTNTADVQAAVSVYDAYCVGKRAAEPTGLATEVTITAPPQQPTQQTGTGSPTGQAPATVTVKVPSGVGRPLHTPWVLLSQVLVSRAYYRSPRSVS